jgi:RimJ/RimL family protein N-acetyltransferase
MRTYRKLIPAERGEFQHHLLQLAPEDRRSRFAGSVSDLSVMEYCARIDWLKTVIIGCFIDGALRGAVELHFDDPQPAWRCELAVTVEHDWQEQGIGTELLQRAITLCRNRSIHAVSMICLLDNRRMQRIARKFEGQLAYVAGRVEAEVKLPFPTQFTLAAEAMDESAAWMSAWLRGVESLTRLTG